MDMYVYRMCSCRHGVIANYFGDPKPKCVSSCDFCKEPARVREEARGMRLCQKGGSVGGGGMGSFERGQPDLSLYGGGRWGYKRCVW